MTRKNVRSVRGSRAPRRLEMASSHQRITVFFIIVAMMFSLAAGRAVLIQGIDASANAQAAAEQLTRTQVLKAERGIITDRNGQRLAETQPAFMVIADPYSISTQGKDPQNLTPQEAEHIKTAPQEISKVLVQYIGGSTADYLPKLVKKRNDDGSPNMYVMIKRHVAADIYQQMTEELKKRDLYGIYAQPDPVRYYPNGQLAANIIGFVNAEGAGAGGLEYSQDEQLQGIDGTRTDQISAYGPIPLGETALVEPVNGADFQLTIDAEMQWMAETQLAHAIEKHDATSGTAIIMAVQTGEVLAMATAPSFDSNHPEEGKPENLGNRAVTDAYEPGSVQKVLTMAALLDKGLITPETPVVVPGSIMSGSAPIRDAWPHGDMYLTARGVLAMSSNVGTVELVRQMNKADLYGYLSSFGLGQSTGIELPGETGGAMGALPPADMPDYALDQISFGQGLSVTALQEATAVASVTNGGVYHQPTIIASATAHDGEPITFEHVEPRRVISQEASAAVLNMMEASVASPEMGTVDATTIPGYRMAGKSGTAEKIGKYGNYDGGYTGSYVAVAPVEKPQILVYVVIDEPKRGGYFGGVVAYPAAAELMRQALPRYGIPPSASVPDYTDPLTYQP